MSKILKSGLRNPYSANNAVIWVISNSGFSQKAIEYVEDYENWFELAEREEESDADYLTGSSIGDSELCSGRDRKTIFCRYDAIFEDSS